MKQIKGYMFFFIVIIIILPMLLLKLSTLNLIPLMVTATTSSEWIAFWGSYLGGAISGIGTLLAVLFTINFYEKQNKKQLKLLLNQDNLIRINQILEKIHDRETIPNSLYQYDTFKNFEKLIDEYNSLRGRLISYFTDNAMEILIQLLNPVNDENGSASWSNNLHDYFNMPSEIKEYSYIIGKYALYKNCKDLITGDPRFGHMIEKEGGGSYGRWHLFIHEFHGEEYRKKDLREFFELISKLVSELEKYKQQFQS